MDPQVRAFLVAANAVRQPPIETLPIETVRKQFAGLAAVFHPRVEVGKPNAEIRMLRGNVGIGIGYRARDPHTKCAVAIRGAVRDQRDPAVGRPTALTAPHDKVGRSHL